MNDELSSALAELAKGFGVSTGELWSWLQSEGVAAYSKVQVAQLTVQAFGIGIALAVALATTFATWKLWTKDTYSDVGELILMEMIPLTALSLLAVVETVTISNLVGWMASPQGMDISMLLEKVS